MKVTELLYNFRKKVVKFYRDYFTVEGTYTSLLPDKIYLKKLYKKKIGKELNLKNPKTLNEKMQWLKLYNRNPIYTVMADKYLARKFVSEIVGDEYLVPLVGVWDTIDEIDFEALPDKFVLKCNHDNGVIICRCKSKFDIEKCKKNLMSHYERNYYKKHREWPYKNITKKIICEELLENNDGTPLADYKFYCYGGKLRYFMYSLYEGTSNHINHKFDMNLKSIDSLFKKESAIDIDDIRLPENIYEMIALAEIFAKDMPHVRIDMYSVDGRIYIGEFTFFSNGGYFDIYSDDYAQLLADYIDISDIENRRKK